MPIGEGFDGLLTAAASGAEWAWERLYEEFAPPVLGFLRSQGAHDPDDLLGEVFLQLVRGVPTFEGDEARFRSWVFIVAQHRLMDERRRRSRRPEEPSPPETLDRRSDEDPAQEVVDALSADGVRVILAGLTEDQRDVLLLRIVGGLTIAEIAELTGKRDGAIKALQRRGLAAVRQRLEAGPYPFGQDRRLHE